MSEEGGEQTYTQQTTQQFAPVETGYSNGGKTIQPELDDEPAPMYAKKKKSDGEDKSKWSDELIQLSFQDIQISTDPVVKGCCGKTTLTGAPKIVIDGVSGTVMPGQFVAILGASGAGKTVLLNYLSGRDSQPGLIKSGTLTVNGVSRSDIPGYSQLSAYVQQDDVLFQTMTVRECFEFAAKLKLKGTEQSKLQRVEDLIGTLKLYKAQNTLIGGPLVKGISGGERKRTAVGVELITDPALLFLDEPTTGLDSYIATQVMENLRDLAMVFGKTVISTIHQPNTDVFEMFDKLMLLAQGKVIYYNDATKSVEYFASIGREVPDMTNPADYFMTMMAKDGIDPEPLKGKPEYQGMTPDEIRQEEYNIYVDYYDKCYNESNLRNDATQIAPGLQVIRAGGSNKLPTTFCFQFKLLAVRNFLNMIRLPQTSYVKFGTTFATAIFACFLFWRCPHNAQGVQNMQGALFFCVMQTVLNALQNVILIFPEERPCFLREVNNNMYGASPYFWAKICSELPFSIAQPCIFGSIVYYAIGLCTINFSHFVMFLFILILVYNSAQGYALVISAGFSDKQLAVTLTPVLIIPFMLFAGFFVAASAIPVFLREFEYVSIFKYGYNALLLNQFYEIVTDDQYHGTHDSSCPNCFPCLNVTANTGFCSPLSQIAKGDNLDQYPDLLTQLCCLLGIYVLFYAAAWAILATLSRKAG